MKKKKEFDIQELRDLYLIKGLSLAEIALKYGVGKSTVSNRLKEYNIKKQKNEKKKILKDRLYELYINQNLTRKEVAEIENISENIVDKFLNKYNIKKPKELFYSKVKEIVKEKYGVENISQIKEVREKVKRTVLKKYGVDNVSKDNTVKNKKRKKSMEKFGVEYVLSSSEIRERIATTNMKKYGVKNPVQSKMIQDKIKQTNLKRYGVEYPGQSEDIKQRIKKTNIEKYGVPSVLQNEQVKNKIRNTIKNRYGGENNFKSPIIQEKIKQTCIKRYGVPYACMTEKCRKANGNANSKINQNFSIKLKKNGIDNKLEKSIQNYSYDIEILNQKVLIEINPTYTHNVTNGSEFRGHKKKPLDKNYHFNKTLNAIKSGYRCINVWDWDDENKIINILKLKQRIYARDCMIKEISREDVADFEIKYHLQGYCNNQKIRLGLFYLGNLVEVMTFGKPRYNKKYEYELIRLCSHYDYNVIGGASKLFKYFIEKYVPKSIISYCDNSKFIGNVYNDIGFKQKDYGKPSKHWYNPKTKQHITDNLLRQRGYDQLFKTNFGKETSNEKLMIENGFVEIYDCGQSVYLWNK